MHALSKKLYYDVMKSGQEDTILESDMGDEECENEESPGSTSDVGCSVRTHTKSYAVQTQWSRSDKNFRNEYTNTSELKSETMNLNSPISRVIAIHQSISCENIALTRVRSVQTSPVNSPESSMKCAKKDVVVEVRGFQLEKKGFAQLSRGVLQGKSLYDTKSTKTDNSETLHECTNTECKRLRDIGHETCECDEYQSIPCNRGLTACRNFTLGTAEFRRCQNEQCKTKLIGGCRVPVCKNQKSRL